MKIITIEKPMFEFYKKNLIRTTSKGIYQIIADRKSKWIKIPKGFISDGASIPRLFWPLVGGRFSDGNGEAAILHDFLYFIGLKREFADTVFFELMRQNGGYFLTCHIKYACVRLFGWIAYNNHRKAEQK